MGLTFSCLRTHTHSDLVIRYRAGLPFLFMIVAVYFLSLPEVIPRLVIPVIDNGVYSPTSSMAVISRGVQLPSNEESRELYHQVRVLCWVLTMPWNHLTRARHVKRTWGRRCNKLLFMSSHTDSLLDAVNLNVSEGRDHLWDKTQSALRYLYEHHIDDADWFLKADDDTYVIVENLRAFLAGKSRLAPVYFGCRYGAGHVSGGAGYVMSGRSLRLIVERGVNGTGCSALSTDEDVQISACLKAVGVVYGDSNDNQGLPLFNSYTPPEELLESYGYYDEERHLPNATEPFRCSPSVISFHYLTPAQMYALEFFVYHFKLHGVGYPEQSPVAYYIN